MLPGINTATPANDCWSTPGSAGGAQQHGVGAGEEESLPPLRPSSGADASDDWGTSSVRPAGPYLADRFAPGPALFVPADLATSPTLPVVGDSFLGFHLIAELGRGSYGRVFLARQGELAGRLVALKVSTEIVAESQRLARLQHTHIVPIHSLHRAGPLQAVCMPYFGACTLADVMQDLVRLGVLPASGKGLVGTLQDRRSRTARSSGPSRPEQSDPGDSTPTPSAPPVEGAALPEVGESNRTLALLERLSYVEAVLWIASRLADGLAHAHERGILHRDLKPANVLLTDEGQPMLLDFNLAEDTREKSNGKQIGGTLPYMAPEHLAAFTGSSRVVDARSDLYSLGVLLFELLTGRHPFRRPEGPTVLIVPQMIAERLGPPPRLRVLQPSLPRAVENIVRKCLDPNPARRYQTAADLREDLERQLAHQPLRHAPDRSLTERAVKWVRRNPRLAAVLPVVLAASVALAGLASLAHGLGRQAEQEHDRADQAEVRGQDLDDQLKAKANCQAFRAELMQARLLLCGRGDHRGERERGLKMARGALERFPSADAAAPALRPLPPDERARVRRERGELLLLLAGSEGQDARTALEWNRQAEECFDPAPRALFAQRALLAQRAGQADLADQARRQAEQTPIQDALDHFLLARLEADQGHFSEAQALLRRAVFLDPRLPAAWTLLGHLCLANLGGTVTEASQFYGNALELVPNDAALFGHRGLASYRQGKLADAEADFARAVELDPKWPLLRQHHARALEELANAAERTGDSRKATWLRMRALSEFGQAAADGLRTNRALLAQARLRGLLGDGAGAARARTEALQLTPPDAENYLARGVLRLEGGDSRGALADFEASARLDPSVPEAWRNQAHVLAEHLHRDRDALAVMDRMPQPTQALDWSTRAVLAARIGDEAAARRYARAALDTDKAPAVVYQNAGAHALLARCLERRYGARVLAGLLGNGPPDWPAEAARLRSAAAAERDEAIRLLSRAFRAGYGMDLLQTDPDLEPLHADPRYGDLVDWADRLRGYSGKD